MNVKMTQNHFIHLEDHVYQISYKSNIFEMQARSLGILSGEGAQISSTI